MANAPVLLAYGEKRGALRKKNDDGNVRKRGRPKIRWLDGVSVIPKRRDCQGGSGCTTELHNPSNIDSQNSGPKMKTILTDEDGVA